MIKLILTADDFGLHSSINEAVEEAYQKGILTNASLIVNGAKADEAIKICKRNPGLDIGLHYTLVEEAPVSAPEDVASIITKKGLFYENHFHLLKKMMTNQAVKQDIVHELVSQIEYCHSSGVAISHIDSHRHLHVFPPIFKVIRPTLNRYGITKMRYLNVPRFELNPENMFKTGVAMFFKAYSLINKSIYKHPDFFVGFYESGNINTSMLLSWLKLLSSNVYEIALHIGKSDKALKKKYGKWDQYFSYSFSWEKEFNALTDPLIHEYIQNRKIQLINYSHL